MRNYGLGSRQKRCYTTEAGRGTPGYRAPEIYNSNRGAFNNKVNIWATGCILHELIQGRRRFNSDWDVLHYSLAHGPSLEHPALIDNKSEAYGYEFGRLMDALLSTKLSARPSARVLLWVFAVHLQPAELALYSSTIGENLMISRKTLQLLALNDENMGQLTELLLDDDVMYLPLRTMLIS